MKYFSSCYGNLDRIGPAETGPIYGIIPISEQIKLPNFYEGLTHLLINLITKLLLSGNLLTRIFLNMEVSM
jgi:hypothetical protein